MKPCIAMAIQPALAFTLTLAASMIGLAQTEVQTAPGELQNRFNDPFFQFTTVIPDCPMPLGPLITAAEQVAQAARRAQKDVSCVQAGSCDKPNAFAYDADIAAALRKALNVTQLYTHSPLVNSSLWATVQGRVVTIEGCVAGDVPLGFDHVFISRAIETMVMGLPNVVQGVALIRTSEQARAGAAVPYRVRP